MNVQANAPVLPALNGKPAIEEPTLSIYQIVGVVAIFLIIASMFSYSKHLMTVDLMAWIRTNVFQHIPYMREPSFTTHEDVNRSGPATLEYPNKQPVSPMEEARSEGSAGQTWCLVGEDMTGRWCVQVTGAKACDPDRTYPTKNACEGRSPTA